MIGQDRPKLLVMDTLTVTMPVDPYLSLRALAQYSTCSVRWLRDRLVDPFHPLPAYRVPGGKILVRRSEFDGWMIQYRQVGRPDVERVVSTVLRALSPPPATPPTFSP